MPFEALFPWERLSFLPPIAGAPDPAGNRAFEINAHFALYVENYLEGLHVPFVHPGLTQALDLPNYRTELLGASSLQIGAAVVNSPAFDTPDGRVGGYYIALFPTSLINLYPWGLSLNLVEPLGPERTRVRYQRWVRDPALLGAGAGSGLDAVEAEDDAIVELVQRGFRSRLARPGHASPRWEAGLSAFHAQLRALIDDPAPIPR